MCHDTEIKVPLLLRFIRGLTAHSASGECSLFYSEVTENRYQSCTVITHARTVLEQAALVNLMQNKQIHPWSVKSLSLCVYLCDIKDVFQADVERHEPKYGPQCLALPFFHSVRMRFWLFSDFWQPFILKTAAYRAKGIKIWAPWVNT